MRLGIQIPNFTFPGGATSLREDLGRIARDSDQAGFEYLAVMDHFFQIPQVGPVEDDMLEAYTTLGYLAARTERAKLLTVITGAFYRHPGLLGKAVTTLDVLSGGRAVLGVGAGWNEEESRGLGFPFPPLKERFELLEDAVRYCLHLWSADDGVFEGAHVRAERMMNVPQALSRPHPPILIGGGGEKKTLRLVARHAQACNLFNGPELAHKLDVLRRHCENEGRDYDEITKTVYHPMDVGENGDRSDELLQELQRLSGLGVDVTLGMVARVEQPTTVEHFANTVIPQAAKL